MKKVLAIVPARGGSKGVPGKNIADLGGKPLIGWTIESALNCQIIDKVFVSTDDQEIANCAETFGVAVPWLRSNSLATDDAPVILALIDVIERLKDNENYIPDYVLLLQANVPFRTTEDMYNVINMAMEKSADSIVSVCEAQVHPYLSKKIDNHGHLSNFIDVPIPEMNQNRQNLPTAYELNGALYLVKTEILLERKSLYGDKTCAYVMPAERSFDIDTPWDMHLAQLIMQDKQKKSNIL